MMALQQERRTGLGGLDLSVDPAKLAEGALTVADGVRYLEAGTVHSRSGRVPAPLNFPDEGFGSTPSYTYSTTHFKAAGRVRGMAAYYDQRIWPTNTSDVTQPIPQRLNFVYKANGTTWLNTDGASGAYLQGDGSFNDWQTKAKFVVYGDRVYTVDESTAPKAIRRLPKASQTYLTRVKYNIDRMGIVWPTAGSSDPAITTQKPTISTTTGANPLPAGTYRFRLVLENQFGVQSGPSAYIEQAQASGGTINVITVKWNTIATTFPSNATKARVYVQFTALGTSAIEPTAYLYVNSAAVGSGATGIAYNIGDHGDLANRPLMRTGSGAPPVLRDLVIINDVAFAIASTDVIYREIVESEVGTTNSYTGDWAHPGSEHGQTQQSQGLRNNRFNLQSSKLTSKTSVKTIPVTPSYLFWSEPGEPEYMENWALLGNGTEVGVGLAALGSTCVVFTNQGIYTFDANDLILKTVYAHVGCLSRDSIVHTENGIRFIGSDGVPRLFNGATVDETSNELLPVFDRDDYVGDYLRFDKQNAQEVNGTFGDRKFYMTFPVTAGTTYPKPGQSIDSGAKRYLAVGDSSRGRTKWSLDREPDYDIVQWLGRESRLLGIDANGYFYFIEEGLTDADSSGGTGSPSVTVATRKFSMGGLQTQFYRLALDVDTAGETLTLFTQVDGISGLNFSTTVTTNGREDFKTYLPANFKGRYLDVYLSGTPATRVALYGVYVETALRGVF